MCGRSPAEDLPHTFAPRPFTPSYHAKKRLCTVKKARKALPECCLRPPLSLSVSSFFVVYNSTIAQNWQEYLCTFYILPGSIAPAKQNCCTQCTVEAFKSVRSVQFILFYPRLCRRILPVFGNISAKIAIPYSFYISGI